MCELCELADEVIDLLRNRAERPEKAYDCLAITFAKLMALHAHGDKIGMVNALSTKLILMIEENEGIHKIVGGMQ
jgi:hypothetical protein